MAEVDQVELVARAIADEVTPFDLWERMPPLRQARYRQIAEAALSALQAGQRFTAADGTALVLVPVKPTDAMLKAEAIREDRWSAYNYGSPLPVEYAWDAMLSALPAPPSMPAKEGM